MIVLNPGVGGSTLGTNLVAGIDWQVVQMAFGATGNQPTNVTASTPLPVGGTVAVSGVNGTVTVNGTVNISGVSSVSGSVSAALEDGAGNALSSIVTGTTRSIQVAVVNASGQQITSFSGGTGGGTSGAEADASAFTRGTTLTTPIAAVAEANAPTLTQGAASSLSQDLSGNLRVSVQSGGAAAGVAGTPSADVLTVQGSANSVPVPVTIVPGQLPQSIFVRVKAVAGTNSTLVQGAANSVLLGYALYNNATTPRYVKFYNKVTAPTVGTDTPYFTVVLAPGGGANVSFGDAGGVPFPAGLGFAITGLIADTDTTAVAADDVHGMVIAT